MKDYWCKRLAAVSNRVVGMDPDPSAIQQAQRRVRMISNASVELADFANFAASDESFDVITFVASIHHQPLRDAFELGASTPAARRRLAIVGLAANETVGDWAWSLLCTRVVLAGSRLHDESRDVGVRTGSLTQMRRAAEEFLPNAAIRRGLRHRYRLHWRKE